MPRRPPLPPRARRHFAYLVRLRANVTASDAPTLAAAALAYAAACELRERARRRPADHWLELKNAERRSLELYRRCLADLRARATIIAAPDAAPDAFDEFDHPIPVPTDRTRG